MRLFPDPILTVLWRNKPSIFYQTVLPSSYYWRYDTERNAANINIKMSYPYGNFRTAAI